METFSALLVLCAGNSPVTSEFPTQRPVTRSFDVLCLRLLAPETLCFWVVRPSVRSLKYPTNSDRFTPVACLSVRPSGEVSGHLPENAWREWPEILHADASWPPSELIRLWSQSWFSSVWRRHFYFVKWVKFGISGHFPEVGASVWSLICAWTNGWANNRDTDNGNLRRHRAHYDVTVMTLLPFIWVADSGYHWFR